MAGQIKIARVNHNEFTYDPEPIVLHHESGVRFTRMSNNTMYKIDNDEFIGQDNQENSRE